MDRCSICTRNLPIRGQASRPTCRGLTPPASTVNLANPAWTIGEPYGTDMIMAIASSEPLFDRPRPSNAETVSVYLRDLQAAIERARQRGVRLAGAAVTLDALPK